MDNSRIGRRFSAIGKILVYGTLLYTMFFDFRVFVTCLLFLVILFLTVAFVQEFFGDFKPAVVSVLRDAFGS